MAIRTTRASKTTAIVTTLALLLIYWLPLLWMLSVSVRRPGQVFGRSLIPSSIDFAGYSQVFERDVFLTYFKNSLIISFTATLLVLVVAFPAAYAFARLRFPGKDTALFSIMSIRIFPPILLTVVYFRIFVDIGLYDTLWALILLNVIFNLPLAVWLLRNYLKTIPVAIEEAAYVDGASRIIAVRRIVLPLVLPGLAAVSVQIFLLTWNEYVFALTFTSSTANQPATLGIFNFIGEWATNYIGIMAFAVVLSLPVVVGFIAIQRYIVRGVTAGWE